ncbi:MAG TPA: hypothetical protein VKH20_09285 [Solirubrobacterales bacterium]|nr:hypothetical protein [Solirubrobacterales bacterium]
MSADPPSNGEGEVRLDADFIDALARRLAELLADRGAQSPERGLISAAAVAERWGVSRRWVYEQAERLGARRLGAGSRPRLRFDPDEVAEQLGEPRCASIARRDARRSAGISGDCGADSLSGRRRAMVGRQSEKRPGRRTNAPRPGAEGGPSAR